MRIQEFPESWWNQYGCYLRYVNDIPGYGGHFLEDNARTLVVYVRNPDVHGQLAVKMVDEGMARDGYVAHERTVARQTPGR